MSIIVPVYNVEQYLDRCLRSLINQSYKNIEIILVDDGSPDKCPQMCEDWAQKDYRIKVIHKKNGGLSDARNKGIEVARGEYICFVDSDDYIAERYVETLYDLICNNHTEISAIAFKEVFLMEEDLDTSMMREKTITVFEGMDALRELFSNDTFANYAWNKMYKKELFFNVQFPVGKKMEDLGTTYKLLLKAGRIAYSTEILYYYYQREDSILHKTNLSFFQDKFELSRERYERILNIYPDLIENDFFFLEILLEAYPRLYSLSKEYDWKKATKRTFIKCKNMVNLKDRIKYFLLIHCSILYRFISRNKNSLWEKV